MLNVTELRNGTFYKEGKDILLVLTYEHVKTGRGSGNIKVKVRNVRSGSVTEKSFITGARVDEAAVEKKKAQFLYRDSDSPAGEATHTYYHLLLETELLDKRVVVALVRRL